MSTILFEGENGLVYNVDNGTEVTVRTLATAVRDAVDPTLILRFDPSKPTGLAYRVTDPTRLKSLGASMGTNLAEGIGATVADYRARFEDSN